MRKENINEIMDHFPCGYLLFNSFVGFSLSVFKRYVLSTYEYRALF